MHASEVDLVVYPDLCDAWGHLNQASFLTLFERARWEMLIAALGVDYFQGVRVWPAVRHTEIDYLAQAMPGDVLRFQQTLLHVGRTSFSLRQTARRLSDETLIASAAFVFVCLGREGRPVPIPAEFAAFLDQGQSEGVRRMTVNGVALAVDVVGDGPAVLFVHGYPLDRTIWRHQVEHLTGCLRIAPDLRGMGQSDAPDLGYSMTTYADDLAALLDTLGVDSVVLCGLSMGGYICLEFLRRWGQRVRGLVLIDTRAEADSPEGRKGRDTAAQLARDKGSGAIAEAMLPKLFAEETREAVGPVWDQVRQMIARTPVPGIVGALTAMRDRPDSTALLSTLGALPVLIIAGANDRIISVAEHRKLAAEIPSSRLEILPGAGHLPTLETPEVVTAAMQGFVDGLGAVARTE